MSIPFGFHVEDPREGLEYFPGEDADEDPWYEGEISEDDPDFLDTGDIWEPVWEEQLYQEDSQGDDH